MLDTVRRPLPYPHLIGAVTAATLAVALYCVAYTTLAGRPESIVDALGWAIANVAPWLLAIELGKRAEDGAALGLALAAALIASLALGYLFGASNDVLPFELVRRLPALAAVAAAVALLRSPVGRSPAASPAMPLAPEQIDWVRAAGNYVELRARGRTIVHRSSIAAAERALAPHGFVRIHRSLLVRRDVIARVRPEDVVLADGTHLRVGKRYRAALAA